MDNTFYELMVTLSEYPGNHERELTYWLFGLQDEFMPGGWEPIERPHAEKMAWVGNLDDPPYEVIMEQYVHDEYGPVWQSIEGLGLNTVSWKFTQPLTDEQWSALLDVLEQGYQPRKSYHTKMPDLVTLTLPTLTKVETVRTPLR